MYPQEFKVLNRRLNDEVKQLTPRIKNSKYTQDVKSMLKKFLPKDFIFLIGNELAYNIQSVLKKTWIFILEEKVKVIIYKARPYGYPQIQAFQFFKDEDEKKYLVEDKDQNCQDIVIEKNNLIPEEKVQEIKNFIQMFFNKYPEKSMEDKGRQVDRDVKFLQVFKTFCYLQIESLFMHFAFNQKKNFQFHIPQNIELEDETKYAKINFHLGNENRLYTLLIFEKEGEKLDLWFKISKKWKEICIFLLMFSLLLVLSSCKKKLEDTDQQSLLCRNKPQIVFYVALSVIFIVGFKFVSKRREKNLKKKKQIKFQFNNLKMVQPKNYYSYLKKFSPGALRKYQTGYFYDMGRRSQWDLLVTRFAVLSTSHENYIFIDQKLPLWIVNLLYRSIVLVSVCWLFTYVHGPSEPSKYFETTNINPRGLPSDTYNRKINYQDLYDYQRGHARNWV